MPRVGILGYLHEAETERSALGGGVEIALAPVLDDAAMTDAVAGADALILWHTLTLSTGGLDRLRACRAIIRAGVGYDNLDIREAARRGIPVATVPDYGTGDVADLAIGFLLALARRIPLYDGALRRDPVANWRPQLGAGAFRTAGRTLGIVGLGRIGSSVALRARALGMAVAFYDPYAVAGSDKVFSARRCATLEELTELSDALTLHAPSTPTNRGMIGAAALARLKPGAILINTARGDLVDLAAVAAALKAGRLAGFAADVQAQEPPDPEHPLIVLHRDPDPAVAGRIVLTPHMGFYSAESELELRTKTARLAADALAGRPLAHCVNADWLDAPRTPVDRAALVRRYDG